MTDREQPGPKVFKVSEITALIRAQLEEEFPNLTIEGEISNFRPSGAGHMYFTLKDQDAVISVVMFRGRASGLLFTPQDGMMVRAAGSISVYAKRGNYQLICESMTQSGEGELLALIEERKKRLAAEGIFDSDQKKRIPILPHRIAVITSPTGAAIRDILRVLKRRNAQIDLVILPSPVQGEEAARQIIEQIRIANQFHMADVLIVSRGGGSLEDLLPFYDESLARAVAASDIPVISAVGHEIDTTLSDLAADMRAPTPSAAAEMVSASRDELKRRIDNVVARLMDLVSRRFERIRYVLSAFSPENLNRNFSLILQSRLQRYDDARQSIFDTINSRITLAGHRLELVVKELNARSPMGIMERGYAIVTDSDSGAVIKSSDQAQLGGDLNVQLHSGSLRAEVKEKRK